MKSEKDLIPEVIKLVDDGVCVTLPVEGRSMLPFIIGGRESVILQKPSDVMVGDIVLAWVDGCRYVIHRIIRIDGDHVTLMGDGNLVGTESCNLSDIKALATHVIDAKGHRHDLYHWTRLLGAKVWWILRPVRRYLLAIYRRL